MSVPVGWAQTDSVYTHLDSTILVAEKRTSPLSVSGATMSLDLEGLRTVPTLMGNADPIGILRYMPSVSTRTELDAGLHVQGNDHSHNLVSSGGVPLYGVSHLLGLFSVFIPSHYQSMEYEASTVSANRLGAWIDMPLPPEPEKGWGVDFSLGLISTEGTLRAPLGRQASVAVSGRFSYPDVLFGPYLRVDAYPIEYGFSDLGLSAVWRPSAKDRVWLDSYAGWDSFNGLSSAYAVDSGMSWWNRMAALHWAHDGEDSVLEQSAYWTGYGFGLTVQWSDFSGTMPSWIHTAGYRGEWRTGPWTAGWEVARHRVQPQNPVVTDRQDGIVSTPVQTGWENTLRLRYQKTVGSWRLGGGIKGILYRAPDGKWYPCLDPDILVETDFYRYGRLGFRAGYRHQVLFQTGITDLGLPCEFWFLAGPYGRPQTSLGLSMDYRVLFAGGRYLLTSQLYARCLGSQLEYVGNLLDFVNADYSLDQSLLTGSGRAYGASLFLQKVSGALTGWLSYSFGRSLRKYDDPAYPDWTPASFERIHELDAVLSYRTGRWSFGIAAVAASGTPYTPPEALYFLSNHILVQYGPHNSRRLAPYLRTDLSVNYYFHHRGKWESGLDLTFYNAGGRRNEMSFRLTFLEDGSFSYRPVHYNIRFLPSLTYFCKLR